MPSPEGLVQAMKPELNKIFKPAFLGRLVIVPYFPIRDEALKQIIRLKLGKIQKRLLESHTHCSSSTTMRWSMTVARSAAPKWRAARATWTTS